MNYLVTRMLSSFFTGMIISQTGSLTQLLTRNLLASPSTLGIDGLSILWPIFLFSLSLFLHWELNAIEVFLTGAPFFVLVSFVFYYFLRRNEKIETIIFLGLTFNLFVGAVFSLLQFIFMAFNYPFPSELWFGHFKYASPETLGALILFEVLFFAWCFRFFKQIVLLSFGINFARGWGIRLNKLYAFSLIFISLGTFLVISFFGAFSFLGLVFPILGRKLFFSKFDLKGELILGSLFNGFIFMSLDWICFEFPVLGAEVPVGLVVTSFGSLCLILLVWKTGLSERLSKARK